MPKIQLPCIFLQVIGTLGLLADKFAIWRYNSHSQTLCTVYYNWWSYSLISPQVVTIAQAGSMDHWFYPDDNHIFSGNWQYLGAGSLPLQRFMSWILAQIHWNYLVDSNGRTLVGILRDSHDSLLEHAYVGSLSSQHFITPNLHPFAGVTASFDIYIKNSSGNSLGNTFPLNLLQGNISWEVDSICSNWRQVSKKCSLYQAWLAYLMQDVVNILPRGFRLILVTSTVVKDGQPCMFDADGRSQRASIEHPGIGSLSWWSFISQNFHAVMENTRMTWVEAIRLFYYRLKLLCSIWAISMLQDSNFWKEASNAHSSSHQAGKECSWFKACLAFLLPDAVNIPILTSSLRFLETRRYIGISKEASDISSSWHSACFAGFMPDAGNIPLLDVCLEHFESQKNYIQMYHGPLSFQVFILGIETWIYIAKRHRASLVDHDGRPHCPQGYQLPHLQGSMEVCKFQDMYAVGMRLALSKSVMDFRYNLSAHISAHDNPWSMEVLRLDQFSPALWASVSVKPRRTKAGKRTQTVMGLSVVAHTATKITGNSPNRASEGAKDPPSGKR